MASEEDEHARLWTSYKSLSERIDISLTGQHTLAQQIGELSLRVGRVEISQVKADELLKKVVTEVADNTTITKEIRDIITAGRVIKKAGDGVGWLATTAAKFGGVGLAVYGALEAFKTWLKP